MYNIQAAKSTGRYRRREQAYRGMRIGLFGGSFNPAHEGHAHVAEEARKRLGLHRVWWLVTPQNPIKSTKETAPYAERFASADQFARGPSMIASDIEARWGVQFSIDLIERLRKRYPGVTFVWIMGSDNLLTFHRWKRWRRIANSVPIVFVARPGALARAQFSEMPRAFAHARTTPAGIVSRKAPAWAIINAPLVPLSSTMLRRRRAADRKR